MLTICLTEVKEPLPQEVNNICVLGGKTAFYNSKSFFFWHLFLICLFFLEKLKEIELR